MPGALKTSSHFKCGQQAPCDGGSPLILQLVMPRHEPGVRPADRLCTAAQAISMLRGAASHANDDVGIGMLNGRPPTILNADLNGIVYSRTAPQVRGRCPVTVSSQQDLDELT